MAEYKKRRLQKKDWDELGRSIREQKEDRQTQQFRKDHEKVWKEVDRQLRMEPMRRVDTQGRTLKRSWHNAIELGELSKISEVLSADTMRIIFPAERDWFESHVEIPAQFDPQTGQQYNDANLQGVVDNNLRAMMAQQHLDFGFKRRFELSVKEALHHGSFVAEVQWEKEMKIMDGGKVQTLAAPVWVPYSMWNCFPDPSPSIISTNMFYSGSMIVRSYMPPHKLKSMTGEGWMQSQFDKIPDDEHTIDGVKTKDIELLAWIGDLVIPRSQEDIYLPNCKAITANGVIVYWKELDLPHSTIIYGGYERQDVRNPYYTSPIVKQSPTAKIASILANKFLDSVALRAEPPIVYDGLDPYFVENGGPSIYPGAKSATKGAATYKEVEIGDPNAALEGLQLALRQLQEGTGVSAVRSGVPNSDRQTATEIHKIAQGAEVRTVDFVDKLTGYLRSWIYMQHSMNVKNMDSYSFYSDDMDTKDFVRITGKEMKQMESARFDIVGAKGILGEEQRMARTTQVTAFASGNPLFAPLLKQSDILNLMYKDAGNKNPERFVKSERELENPELMQAQQVIQQLQAQMAEMQKDRDIKIATLEQKREQAMIQAEVAKEKNDATATLKAVEIARNYEVDILNIRKDIEADRRKFAVEMTNMVNDMQLQAEKIINEVNETSKSVSQASESVTNASQNVEQASKPKNRKVRFIDDNNAEMVGDDGSVVTIEFPEELQ